MPVMSYIDAVTLALKEEMERDPRVFVLGEDVGKKGGVFKATAGLYEQFGEERVMDTPLAESAIVNCRNRRRYVWNEACRGDAVC